MNKGYHLMAKPFGPICNIKCEYCFYLEKKSLFQNTEKYKMSYEVLENYIKKYIETQDIPEINFVWQGGEPTFASLDFYKDVVKLQKKYAGNKNITNSLQTNGLLIDDDWCKFLKENNFLVGLSLDGNKDIHNKYRKDIFGNGTFDRVFNSLKMLQDYNIDFNVLASVSRYSSQYPLEIYNFFKENKIKYIQFSPIVERLPDEEAKKLSLTHSIPNSNSNEKVTDYSAEPESYGDFLISIFDEWVKKDVGEIFVMNFEWALTSWLGLDSTICLFGKECSGCTVVEHNGDIYSCDHYVYPDYKIGNIITDNPRSIIDSDKQKSFGLKKSDLPKNCLRCDALFACRGECPKNRFDKFYDGEEGKNYLCEGYKKYFYHIHPYMKAMRELLENNIDIREIMRIKESPIVVVKKNN